MKQIFFILLFMVIFAVTSQCGFKKLNKSENQNFIISEIDLNGNKKINYKLKNKLLVNNPNDSENLLKINIETNKKKEIKEKNIRNEITKYLIILDTNIKVKVAGKEKIDEFKLSVRGDYVVVDSYSTTLNNEKNLLDKLIENLSEKILAEIYYIIDDL